MDFTIQMITQGSQGVYSTGMDGIGWDRHDTYGVFSVNDLAFDAREVALLCMEFRVQAVSGFEFDSVVRGFTFPALVR